MTITSTASKPAWAMCRNASRSGRRNHGAVENTSFGAGRVCGFTPLKIPGCPPPGILCSAARPCLDRGSGRRGPIVSEQDNVPAWRGETGKYEVWFLTLTDPAGGRGYWIRSTILAPRKGPVTAEVWFTVCDRADQSRSFGLHRRFGLGDLLVANESFEVRIGDALMSSGAASGSLEGAGHRARWELTYPTGEPTYRLLPRGLYRAGVTPTRPFSPNVDTTVSGVIEVDGEISKVHDARAQQGHLFGWRHPERWAWGHCAEFVEEEAVVQAVTAQQRRGPFVSPFATFVGIRWQGEWIRLSKWTTRRPFGLGTWPINLESRRWRLTGRIEAPARAMVMAKYEDPDGRPRYAHHSDVASARLALFQRKAGGFEEVALLEARGTAHAEWAGLTPARAVEASVIEVEG